MKAANKKPSRKIVSTNFGVKGPWKVVGGTLKRTSKGSRCAISRIGVSQVLEAAHIFPYLGTATNDLRNGILLKSDFQILFDAHLLSLQYVDGALTVRASNRLEASPYAKYQGKIITLPTELTCRPAPEVVSQHLEKFRASEAAKSDEGTSLQAVQ